MKIELLLGTEHNGFDSTLPVEFEGELVEIYDNVDDWEEVEVGIIPPGPYTREELYQVEGGRLIVYTRTKDDDGEPLISTIEEITEADLKPGGRFERLGQKAGYAPPLTLDQALEL